jgi:hypothetical protein
MDRYDSICSCIDNGMFDEVHSAERTGAQRLIAASDPFVRSGEVTKEQLLRLLERLEERRFRGTIQKLSPPPS